jgi:orotate phosphoribosyltransferase/uridine monophosphate synthetase
VTRTASNPGNLWLASVLWDLGAIQFGDFTMGRTAVHSPIYVNVRLLVSHPRSLRRAAQVIRDEVRALQAMLHPHVAPFDLVAGVPFGGLHIATAYSLVANTPMIYLHPARDDSGALTDGSIIEGTYMPGQTVLIIDDLITGGGSIVETAERLREAGLMVKDAVVLIDREQGGREYLRRFGIRLVPILNLEVMLNYLMSRGKIEEEWYQRSIGYLRSFRS